MTPTTSFIPKSLLAGRPRPAWSAGCQTVML